MNSYIISTATPTPTHKSQIMGKGCDLPHHVFNKLKCVVWQGRYEDRKRRIIVLLNVFFRIERSINEHANIVHAVKNCYKRKIDYRELRSVFLCFLRGRRPLYIPIRASLPSKCSPFGRQRSPKCNATGVLLESNSCPFAKKRSPFKDSLFAHLTSS